MKNTLRKSADEIFSQISTKGLTFTDKEDNRVIFEVGNKAFEKEIAEVEEMLAMEEPDCEDLEADEEIDEL